MARSVIFQMPIKIKILLLFLAVFAWFFCTKWYSPAELIISGSSPGKDGSLQVSWESGEGNNGYEVRRFLLDTFSQDGRTNHDVTIRYTGEKHSGSLSSEIVCRRIAIDNSVLDLTSGIFHGEKLNDSQAVRLSKPGDEIALQVEAKQSIEIQIDTNNQSGKVEIIVNGKSKTVDLYFANIEARFLTFRYWVVGPTGEFRVSMEMPRYKIHSLTVANGNPKNEVFVNEIRIDAENSGRVLFAGQHEKLDKKSFRRVSVLQKRYFHKIQFLFQLFFAALTTWILTAGWRIYYRCRSTGGIFCQRRRVFWAFFAVSVVAFSLWLLAFWPGVLSVDSLKIWRAAVLPEVFLNDHPLLNVLLYRYLAGIWSNTAIVPIFHITMMSGVLAYIFYVISRQGVSLKLLVPFYLLVVTSVPVGLYNVVLWKDIPFALLLVFWAFSLADFYRKKKEGCFSLTMEQVSAFLLLLLALAFTRHNGLVYLVVIPGYIVLLRLVPIRIVLYVFVVGVGMVGLGLLVLASDRLMPSGNYLFSQGASFLSSLLHKSIPDLAVETWRNYWGILNINQKDSAWDLWHYFLNDRFSYGFLVHAGWNDVYKYLLNAPVFPQLTNIAMKIYWKSYEVPFVYLSWNPVHFLGIYLLVILMFRKFPLTAIFSGFVLVQVFTLLVVIDVMNWRYYYFACLGGHLLVPLMMWDIQRGKENKSGESRLQNAV